MYVHRPKAIHLITSAAILASLTSCSGSSGSRDDPSSVTKNSAAAVGSTDASEAATPSAVRLRYSRNGKPASFRTTQAITGLKRYTVYPGDKIDGALGIELGKKADAFLKEHYLRRDRWSGEWAVKEGEVDSYADKVTPARAAKVERFLSAFEDAQNEHGVDADDWPKAVQKEVKRFTTDYGSMTFNFDGQGDGKTAYVYRAVTKQIFRGKAAWGWGGEYIGKPITFTVFERRRSDGSGKTENFNMFQAWEKVKGDWLVSEAGYDLHDPKS